jgi:hypothetical protein
MLSSSPSVVSVSLLSIVVLALEGSSSPELECELFIAESTIPHAGYGVFSAIELKPNDMIGNGDVAFALLDLHWPAGPNSRETFEVRQHGMEQRCARKLSQPGQGTELNSPARLSACRTMRGAEQRWVWDENL